MSVKVEQGVKFEIRPAELKGVYLPGRLEYNEIEEEFYQFLQINILLLKKQNLKLKISKEKEEPFFRIISRLFTGEELYDYGVFHRSHFQYRGGLPENGKDFLIKKAAKVKAFLVNEEVVAIANSSGDCWLILETLGSPKKDMCLYEIDTVKQIFINKEKEKLQKKHEEVIAYLEQLITNVDDKEKGKNIKETLEILNNADLTISSK